MINKLLGFLSKNKLLLLILALGFFLRTYKVQEFFMYGHDHDLAGWFVRDVVDNKHLRLIGQETSTQGIFIGPLYYYLLIPFYLLFNMDPIGGVVMITLLGIFSIWSVYYVFGKVLSKREGLIASFLYAVSCYIVFNDREVFPTTPVITWTVWFFYGLDLLLRKKQKKGLLILGILIGLIWHINIALVLLIPLIPMTIMLSKEKLKFRNLEIGMLSFLILSLPLILFELRHNFSQTRWFFKSLTTNQHAIVSGFEQFRRAVHLFSKNIDGLIWGSIQPLSYETTFFLLIILFIYFVFKKVIKKQHTIILTIWPVLIISFFSIYSKNLSEYYFNGALFPVILILTIVISLLVTSNKTKILGLSVLIAFSILNLHQFFTLPENKSGYIYRKAVVDKIDQDAKEKEYPCVAVSYITKPGYDLGYRYFFYLKKMHVNNFDSGSPIYTIVFPLRKDIEVDSTFGHIGLIYPDYISYTKESIKESCEGENSNLTDPMFGFTN